MFKPDNNITLCQSEHIARLESFVRQFNIPVNLYTSKHERHNQICKDIVEWLRYNHDKSTGARLIKHINKTIQDLDKQLNNKYLRTRIESLERNIDQLNPNQHQRSNYIRLLNSFKESSQPKYEALERLEKCVGDVITKLSLQQYRDKFVQELQSQRQTLNQILDIVHNIEGQSRKKRSREDNDEDDLNDNNPRQRIRSSANFQHNKPSINKKRGRDTDDDNDSNESPFRRFRTSEPLNSRREKYDHDDQYDNEEYDTDGFDSNSEARLHPDDESHLNEMMQFTRL